MELEVLKVGGKIGQLYFSMCPNCKKYIVNVKTDTVVCLECKKKYRLQYPNG